MTILKQIIIVLLLFFLANSNAQEKSSKDLKIKKDLNGISIDAPEGVHQYEFRIGEWESTFKSIQRNGTWRTGTGQYRVFVADNGLTFIEEGLDEEGNVTHRITFDYIEATDSWENNYIDVKTGRKVKYTSKMVNGNLVETIKRENNENNNTYTSIGGNIYIYTARRTFNNGYTLVNHVGISTKKVKVN